MSQFQYYFENNKSNAIHKWIHYFDIYDTWFKKYKNKPIVILEIGVYQGGSLNMWRDYFGEEAKIYAIDINPLCKQFETINTKIFIGSQEDKKFLKYVKSQVPKFDILIDDGGHTMRQQIVSFEELYDHIKDDGVYLCEDLHTSYWNNYGGGYKNPNSFIEYSKNFIDSINAWHSKDNILKVNEFTKSTYALHYYDSVLVLEKKLINPPIVEMMGEIIIPIDNFPTPVLKPSFLNKTLKNNIKKIIKNIYKDSKNYFWDNSFKRMLINSKNSKKGMINLFGKEFYYHYGLAFYDTYLEIFENNIYEFITINPKPIIIDCGANMGLSVLYFSKKYPNAEIVAFEPDETVLPFLEKNIYSQDIKNVELIKKAVWIEETGLEFYTDNGLGGRVGKEYKDQLPKIIKAIRLKYFLNRPIAMLKMDIEGSEYLVLQDCEDLLYNVDHIFIEYHSFYDEEQHLEDILNIFKRQGFRYHLKESFSRKRPFIDTKLVCERFDMAINIFAYKN